MTLHLLNILPFPSGRPDGGWDRAYELIPAAQIAQEQINNASDLLSGYKLEVVTVQSESCGLSVVNDGLLNTFQKIADPRNSLNVVGLSGLFCSTVTHVLAPIFGIPSLTYLQVAASTTPDHRDSERYPWLVHLISTSAGYNDAVLAMMREFNWRRIGIVYNSMGALFRGLARDLAKKEVFVNGHFTLSSSIPMTSSSVEKDLIYPLLISEGTRVVIVTGSIEECVAIMCSAYKMRANYPGYVYIFYTRILSEFIRYANTTECSVEQILQAMEGVFILSFNIGTGYNGTMVSGVTYQEYLKLYQSLISKTEDDINTTLNTNNTFANVMYDEVWTFALALNASLKELEKVVNLGAVTLKESEKVAGIIRSKIPSLSFQGASGYIKFDENRDESTEIEISQVINGSEIVIAIYDKNLTLLRDLGDLPGDGFNKVHRVIPLWLTLCFTVLTLFCFVFTAVIFIIILWYRKRPEVKASSPVLLVIIFIGCFATYLATELRTLLRGWVISHPQIFTLVCNLEIWLGILGMYLIFSTLLVRLFRIRYIFFKDYGERTKYLEDRYLIGMVFLLSGVGVAILSLWVATDTIVKYTTIQYMADANPPHFEILSVCTSKNLEAWLGITFGYAGIMVAIVVFIAVQTRKIRISNFKDTKKLNIYFFVTAGAISVLLPLFFVSEKAIKSDILSHICCGLVFITVGFNCQIFIFIPLVVVMVRNMRKEQIAKAKPVPKYRLGRKETQFAVVY